MDAPDTLHHLIARGTERRKILLGGEDYENFLLRLEKTVSAGGAQVPAWSAMPTFYVTPVLRTRDHGPVPTISLSKNS